MSMLSNKNNDINGRAVCNQKANRQIEKIMCL